jgi:uncharacterized protein YndB with AHSA1/START domain
VRSVPQRRLYRVRVEPLRDIDAWLTPYRELWSARLDDLERHLDTHAGQPRRGRAMTLGSLQEHDGRWQVRFTRALPPPPEKVWQAITEPEHLRAWFPTTVDGERAAGAVLRFTFPDGEGPDFDGEMLTYEPPSLLEFRWGDDVLRFELRPEGTGTLLTLVDAISELGRAARDGAGWHSCLDLLECAIADEEPSFDTTKRWSEVHPRYVETMGPEASTIGPPEPYTDQR